MPKRQTLQTLFAFAYTEIKRRFLRRPAHSTKTVGLDRRLIIEFAWKHFSVTTKCKISHTSPENTLRRATAAPQLWMRRLTDETALIDAEIRVSIKNIQAPAAA